MSTGCHAGNHKESSGHAFQGNGATETSLGPCGDGVALVHSVHRPIAALKRRSKCPSVRQSLLDKVHEAIDPLIDEAGAQALMKSAGLMFTFENEAAFQNATYAFELRKRNGVDLDLLDGNEARQVELISRKILFAPIGLRTFLTRPTLCVLCKLWRNYSWREAAYIIVQRFAVSKLDRRE